MSSYRRSVLIVGAIVMLGMTLFPPWARVLNGNTFAVLGYSPIFSPPVRPLSGLAIIRGDRELPDPGTQVDLRRLLVQYLAVAVVVGVAFAVHTGKPRNSGEVENRERKVR